MLNIDGKFKVEAFPPAPTWILPHWRQPFGNKKCNIWIFN